MEIFTEVNGKERFLENLKLVMEKKGLSYKDVADACGFSKQRMSDIFNKPNTLNLATTDHISKSLGYKETDLNQDDFKKRFK